VQRLLDARQVDRDFREISIIKDHDSILIISLFLVSVKFICFSVGLIVLFVFKC